MSFPEIGLCQAPKFQKNNDWMSFPEIVVVHTVLFPEFEQNWKATH